MHVQLITTVASDASKQSSKPIHVVGLKYGKVNIKHIISLSEICDQCKRARLSYKSIYFFYCRCLFITDLTKVNAKGHSRVNRQNRADFHSVPNLFVTYVAACARDYSPKLVFGCGSLLGQTVQQCLMSFSNTTTLSFIVPLA